MTRALFLLPLATVLSAACVLPTAVAPAPAPAPSVPLEVVVRLEPADRALLQDLVTALGGAARGARPFEVPSVPEPVRAAPRRPALPRQPLRSVDEGPVLEASYNSGAPLYQGQQVQLGEDWVRHGVWRAWYADGKPWEEGAYFQGEEHGPWRWWYENGALQAQGSYEHGAHVGEWTYFFENGRTLAQGSYAGDRPVGRWRTWAADGALLSEGDYLDGLRTGRWVFQRAPGVADPELSGVYEAGERVGD